MARAFLFFRWVVFPFPLSFGGVGHSRKRCPFCLQWKHFPSAIRAFLSLSERHEVQVTSTSMGLYGRLSTSFLGFLGFATSVMRSLKHCSACCCLISLST